jgi:hypothetical protein
VDLPFPKKPPVCGQISPHSSFKNAGTAPPAGSSIAAPQLHAVPWPHFDRQGIMRPADEIAAASVMSRVQQRMDLRSASTMARCNEEGKKN